MLQQIDNISEGAIKLRSDILKSDSEFENKIYQ